MSIIAQPIGTLGGVAKGTVRTAAADSRLPELPLDVGNGKCTETCTRGTPGVLVLDSQYFERIFGMFQRLHKREEFAGTGIGLAICKKIVERHGGTISVESQPGQGATFRFGLAASERKS